MDFGRNPGLDLGPGPVIIHTQRQANRNRFYRAAIWTGKYLQVTVMSIPRGGDIGLERHENLDQLVRVESGYARVYMGSTRQGLRFIGNASAGDSIIIPAGTWHNIVNAAGRPLKLSSVYAPPQHPFGIIHETKEDAQAENY